MLFLLKEFYAIQIGSFTLSKITLLKVCLFMCFVFIPHFALEKRKPAVLPLLLSLSLLFITPLPEPFSKGLVVITKAGAVSSSIITAA